MGEVRSRTSAMEERFKKLREAPKCPQYSSKPKIQKVPSMLRDHLNFEKYYEPRAVALGPFHHGNPRCELAQGFKLMLTSKFIEYVGQKDEDLYKKIEENIVELRDCYVEEATSNYDDETLAWMLFLDGCSTLQFIYSFMHEELEKEFKIKRDQIAFSQQDLFLLENQVPYQVLELLMSSSDKQEKLKDSIEKFVQININPPDQKQSKGQEGITANKEQKQRAGVTEVTEPKKEPSIKSPEQKQQGITTNTDQEQQPGVAKMEHNQQSSVTITLEKEPGEEPTHLLDLLRRRMLDPPKPDVSENGVIGFIAHLLHLLWTRGPPKPNVLGDNDFTGQSFRNVQELNAAGIHFKPSSRSRSSLRDISFVSHCFAGFLSLPPISVDDSTGPKFMNLIAYEMCPDFQNDFGVTSYIGFLDALIDNADDVKKLRSSCVLYNLLGSDKEVAQLFNEIGTDLVPNNDIYRRVKAEIEKHYKTKWKTWMSQFCHDHFSSPWTFLAFMGVLAALWLSGIQTWYTVNSPPSACDLVCQYLKTRLHLK